MAYIRIASLCRLEACCESHLLETVSFALFQKPTKCAKDASHPDSQDFLLSCGNLTI